MAKKTIKKEKKIKSSEKNDEDIDFSPEEEQGATPEETREEIEQGMKTGKKEKDLYTEEGLDVEEEEDELEPWEEGFMEGAKRGGELGKDAFTGEPLMGAENVIELEHDGKLYRFVSKKNAQAFLKKKENEKKKIKK